MRFNRRLILLALLSSCALLLLLLTFATPFAPRLDCCAPSLWLPVPLSAPSPAVCATTLSPIRAGGFSYPQPATPHIQLLISAHSTAIQSALNLTTTTFSSSSSNYSSSSSPATASTLTALTWCSQVVAGTNYAIAVEVAGGGEAEAEGEGDVGVRRVAEVGIFEGHHWSFSGEVARRLQETNTLRSELNKVNGVFLDDEQRSWSEHHTRTM